MSVKRGKESAYGNKVQHRSRPRDRAQTPRPTHASSAAKRHQQPAFSNNTMESLILFAALFVLVVTKATALAAVVNFVTNT
jgi:hypothetical protein